MLQAVLQGWIDWMGEPVAGRPWRSADSLVRSVPVAPGAGREAGMKEVGEEGLSGPGDVQDAFHQAFAEHERDVVRVCRRLLGGREEARDAPQEVFLRARQAYETFDSARPFRPWLLAIAGNYCIDQLRRQSVQQRVFAELDDGEAEPRDVAALSPLGSLLAREERDRLGRAIAKLPLKYRLPLALRYFNELDYDAIAQTIGVSRGQVGTLLFRGKRRLRESLREDATGSLDRGRP